MHEIRPIFNEFFLMEEKINFSKGCNPSTSDWTNTRTAKVNYNNLDKYRFGIYDGKIKVFKMSMSQAVYGQEP